MRTFSLGAGKDTVVFTATAAANGEDTITNFTVGADKLNVKDMVATQTGGVKVTATDISSGLTSGSGYVVAITDGNGGAKIYTYTASTTSASISDIQSKGTLFAELVGIDGTLQSSDFITS